MTVGALKKLLGEFQDCAEAIIYLDLCENVQNSFDLQQKAVCICGYRGISAVETDRNSPVLVVGSALDL